MPYLAQTCQESAKSAPRAAKLRRMTDAEIGRRVKAALAYGGFKLDAAGGILGFSPRTQAQGMDIALIPQLVRKNFSRTYCNIPSVLQGSVTVTS
jgi:hypothetical protein